MFALCGDAAARLMRCACSKNDTKLAQKLGELRPFIAVFPQECMGQLASFCRAILTRFSRVQQISQDVVSSDRHA